MEGLACAWSEAGVRSGESPDGAFEGRAHLDGIVGILGSLGWGNSRHDPDLTRRSLTVPGVTAIVAAARDTGEVVGSQVFSDGVFQAHLGLLAVEEGWGNEGGS